MPKHVVETRKHLLLKAHFSFEKQYFRFSFETELYLIPEISMIIFPPLEQSFLHQCSLHFGLEQPLLWRAGLLLTLHSIAGLYPQRARGSPQLAVVATKNVSRYDQTFPGGKGTPVHWNQWNREILSNIIFQYQMLVTGTETVCYKVLTVWQVLSNSFESSKK